ncbi:hypothetical protein PENNAL_c0102G10107 [Penicillium nalgiovense]|uniref:Uncharacterized protein n=1 Tax=Penicillium nalgiovense TaxID=60175 RepID=A0A1V6X8Z7_PENNA|nr:hypothetical protein PENNAL_c0102G10107 [Penicillium nalgiovense]
MYRLFGDLFLDPPPPDRLEALEKCRPKLRDLETREKPTPDMAEIKEKLQSFRIVETQKWKEMAADQSIFEIQIPEHIVAPSGSWAAKVSHHLHVPSFTTLNIRNGETGDPTSPCTRIVLDDAFDHNTLFMYDHFHRRESFSPFKGYPPHLRSIQEDHTTWIRKTISAKIEIIYGRRVQRSENDEDRISRILLFAVHPQRFLSLNSLSTPEAILQDQIITCACKLAGLPFNDDFYSTREWTSKSDFIHKTSIKALGITEAERSDTLASAISARAAEPSSSDAEVPKVSGTAVMSLQRLYYVLQDLLERKGSLGNRQFRDRSRHITINEHGFPSSSSPLLREWIEGQQKYFFKRLVQKPIDIIPAYVQFCTKDCKSSVSASIPPPLEMLLSLMNFQQARLNPDTADHRNHCRSQIFSTFEIVPRVSERLTQLLGGH